MGLRLKSTGGFYVKKKKIIKSASAILLIMYQGVEGRGVRPQDDKQLTLIMLFLSCFLSTVFLLMLFLSGWVRRYR